MKIETYIRKIAKVNPTWKRGRTDVPVQYLCLRGVPIVVTNGDKFPQTVGEGYWKTGFNNNGFQKVLYTPSTLRINVGCDFIAGVKTIAQWAAKSPASPYNQD